MCNHDCLDCPVIDLCGELDGDDEELLIKAYNMGAKSRQHKEDYHTGYMQGYRNAEKKFNRPQKRTRKCKSIS